MRKVYLDHAATNPLLPEVREAMLPFLGDIFEILLHCMIGVTGQRSGGNRPTQVAELIGISEPEEIIFTSSGTESNNFAIKGLALAQQNKGKHIIISAIEHFSVMNSAKSLEKLGFEVTQVPVDKYGLVNPEDVEKRLRPDTILVSIMHANGEVGTIEPIQEISKITRGKKVVFHTDAVLPAVLYW